jgi:hydrogenase-4 component B
VSAALIVAGAWLCAASGLPALFLSRTRRVGSTACAILLLSGAVCGVAGAVLGLRGEPEALSAAWSLSGWIFQVRVDVLSAFFVAPVFFLAGAAGLYGHRYWPMTRRRGGYVRCFFGLLTGALAIVMTASHMVLFVGAIEVVGVAAFFLVATEDDNAAARNAAWLYLAASHVATLALIAVIGLLHGLTHSWAFLPLPAGAAAVPVGKAIFWLALLGFGIKAGVMPLHVWLPGAHAAAPSHVSALMSGVVIKLGIYGLLRVLSLYDAPPSWFGGTLLAVGMTSSVLGVALALAQHDLKRLLAYHSIENIGIIITGIGVGIFAGAHGYPDVAFLGFAGGLLHVWNHGLFKGLLFLGAGSAIQGVHTREIDRMGGLAHRMPWTAGAFFVGAMAICGLPPLNGFVSEWLVYVASFLGVQRVSHGGAWVALAAVGPALALTGALALACFVKAFGAVFLGQPRSAAAAEAAEAPVGMRLAMLALALGCAAIGTAPNVLASTLERVVSAAGGPAGKAGATLQPIQAFSIGLAVVLIIVFAAVAVLSRGVRRDPTWGCGYALPSARMQYTASSFARTLVGFFSWAVPVVDREPGRLPTFPDSAAAESHTLDPVLDLALMPSLRRARWALSLTRILQAGRIQVYLLYVVATLVALLVWSSR